MQIHTVGYRHTERRGTARGMHTESQKGDGSHGGANYRVVPARSRSTVYDGRHHHCNCICNWQPMAHGAIQLQGCAQLKNRSCPQRQLHGKCICKCRSVPLSISLLALDSQFKMHAKVQFQHKPIASSYTLTIPSATATNSAVCSFPRSSVLPAPSSVCVCVVAATCVCVVCVCTCHDRFNVNNALHMQPAGAMWASAVRGRCARWRCTLACIRADGQTGTPDFQ